MNLEAYKANVVKCLLAWLLLLAVAQAQNVEAYKANGLKWGRIHGANLAKSTGDVALAATYYDATRVFQQLGLEESAAIKVYRDSYVLPNNGAVPGYWTFTDGLTDHALRGDAESKRAALLISQNAMYHQDWKPTASMVGVSLSRENAYALLDHLNAERLGEPRRERLAGLFNNALGHVEQWQKPGTYVQPFMCGLTATALIRYHDQVEKDPRIVPALKRLADSLWANAWRDNAWSFYYESTSPDNGAPDLNLLIMPLYAFVYRETGVEKYREQAIQIFDGGVNGAWLDGPKQFNQTYLRGWESLKWIEQDPRDNRIKELEAVIERVREAVK